MVLGAQQLSAYIWLGFLGAGVATVMVYGVASLGREGATPVKLALAGAAVTAGFTSLTTAIVMINLEALNELRFWQVGSLAGRYMPVSGRRSPFIAVGLVVALRLGRALNGLALGDDVARALGQRVRLTRIVLFVTVAVLCGAATAACGPIVFVGPRRAAPRAAALRPRLPLDPALLARPHADRAAARRHHRTDGRCRPASCRSASCSASSAHRCSSPSCATATWRSCERRRPRRSHRPPQRAAPSPPPRGPTPARVVVTAALGAVAFALFVLDDDGRQLRAGPVGRRRVDAPPARRPGRRLHRARAPAPDGGDRARGRSRPRASPGIVFQTLLANPLASPDFVGVSAGASLFASPRSSSSTSPALASRWPRSPARSSAPPSSTCWPGGTASPATASS